MLVPGSSRSNRTFSLPKWRFDCTLSYICHSMCLLLSTLLVGCGGGGGNDGPSQYTVGGTVTGLAGQGLQLTSAGSNLSIAKDGSFTFPTSIAINASYSVTVSAQPSNPTQNCAVTNGSGAATANVTNVTVKCVTSSYALRGSASGLTGTGLVLQTADGDSLALASNGPFNFTSRVLSSTSYSISISSQPTKPSQQCTLTHGSGTVAADDITNIAVTCSTLITSKSASDITRLGNTTGEILMQLASFMGERLTYLNNHLSANVTENCSDLYQQFTAGSASYTFQDKDNSASLTSGDVVSISLSGCLSWSMADDVSGNVTFTLTAPTNTTPNGPLVFAAKADLDGFTLAAVTLNGTLNARYSAAETGYAVQANIGATPVTFAFSTPDTVLVSNASVSKVIDYTLPRYSVQIAESYQSQRLNGTFSVTTPTALSGRIAIYPDTGMETFTSGPSVLNYSAQNIDFNANAKGSLDQSGSGTFVDLGTMLSWQQGFNGFAWWEPRGNNVVSIGQTPSYQTRALHDWQLYLLFTEPQQSDPANGILSTGIDVVATPIKLFFNGPIDPNSDALIFNTEPFALPGQVAVPAVVTTNGAIATVTSQSPLMPGASYQLNAVSTISSPWSPPGVGIGVNQKITTLN
jgi:hypothetical protein